MFYSNGKSRKKKNNEKLPLEKGEARRRGALNTSRPKAENGDRQLTKAGAGHRE